MQPDDRQLLIRTHQGHEASARELWARYSPRLLAYARSIVGGGAEDVLQSVFLSVIKAPAREVRKVQDPAAWLMVMTRRGALNQLRSARREHRRRQAWTPPRMARGCSAFQVEELASSVEALPRRLREVVVLRHIAGLTFDQVALALGANRNTAAARYREAIGRLRAMLGEDHAEAMAGMEGGA